MPRANAGQAIDLLATERGRVLDRLCDAFLEFLRPAGVAADAALALRPVAGRQVVQDL
ncbi:hypothetical protein D3C83_188460 [compost metagenome]